MVCLIEQDGREIVWWCSGPTLQSVASKCADERLKRELLPVARYKAHGIYRLQGGRYTLLVGTGGIRDRGLVTADELRAP
jgi:hypothetical protein